jgi:hypothetical protein
VYLLGRNGEPQARATVEIAVKHKDIERAEERDLETDRDGKVKLGELKEVSYVAATATVGNGERISDSWFIAGQEADKWTQADDIHIIEGEHIELPINFDDSKPLAVYEASLLMSRDKQILENLFTRIQIVKAESGMYHLLKIQDLEVGDYVLKLNTWANQK